MYLNGKGNQELTRFLKQFFQTSANPSIEKDYLHLHLSKTYPTSRCSNSKTLLMKRWHHLTNQGF